MERSMAGAPWARAKAALRVAVAAAARPGAKVHVGRVIKFGVTRGVRRPFQIDHGLSRLLEAYARFGGRPVEAAHVHLHELCMAALWYRDSLRSSTGEPPDQALARLRGLLRRLGA